jgi:hypothetical protein
MSGWREKSHWKHCSAVKIPRRLIDASPQNHLETLQRSPKVTAKEKFTLDVDA